jgi:transposase
MSDYLQGLTRQQQLLFPDRLDDYVEADNAVRAIDSYVDMLDVDALGFKTRYSDKHNNGRPAFCPKLMLKLYLYGYINKVRSSRSLAKEAHRNIELIWLLQDLKPTYKTIANFRKNNAHALKNTFKEFVLLCQNINLIEGKLVALDGAFLRANASKNQLIAKSTLKKRLVHVTQSIEDYLTLLNTADQQQETPIEPLDINLGVQALKNRKQKLEADLNTLERLGKNQHNKTDPDASLMSKRAHHLIAYNCQIVVDDKEKLIVATAVSNKGNDMQELHHMASQAKTTLGVETLDVVADKGYYSAQEIKKCVDDGIISPIDTQRQQKHTGRYGKDDFVYNKEDDEYICPNNKKLTKKTTPRVSKGKVEFIYKSSAKDCKACPLRTQCLSDKTPRRSIQRWEHEAFIQAYRQNMQTASSKAIIKRRGAIVEHPFGTIKRTLGWDHYLVRGKEKVSGENALIMFCYNFKRVLNILGITLFKKVLLAIKAGDIEAIAQEIARYLSFCTQYSIIYARNIYLRIKQGHFYRIAFRSYTIQKIE